MWLALAASPIIIRGRFGVSRGRGEVHVRRWVAMGVALAAWPAVAGDIEYGAYLASDCTSCHRPGGERGIPPIAGLPQGAIAEAMRQYREGERRNPTMQSVARSLGPEEIEALAAYFASLEDGRIDSGSTTHAGDGGKP
jgi:cytochrome c553